MNKKRLLKLADLLEADAKNKKGIKFSIGTWGEADGKVLSLSCNTTACALGLAALSRNFRSAGLEPRAIKYETWVELGMRWKGRAVRPLVAARRLFDISREDAAFLFMPGAYSGEMHGALGERTVAKRLRDFVAGKVVGRND